MEEGVEDEEVKKRVGVEWVKGEEMKEETVDGQKFAE